MDKLNEILKKAEYEHDKLKHPYVGTEHLLLAILAKDNELTNHLKDYNLTYNKFKKQLINIIGIGNQKAEYVLYTPMLRNVLNEAEKISLENNIQLTDKELFKAIIMEGEGIAIRIMQAMNIEIEDINLDSTTQLLDIDETEIITNREKEISSILQILMRKNKCNPLLIGDAGVGKTAIVEEIARRLNKANVPESLKGYKIMKIDLSELIAGTKYRGDFEEKLNKILHQVEHEKKIIFIDEIHTLVNAGGADGAISAGDIVKPYLARGKIKCIGATTINEYHKYFMIDQALNRRFQTILIRETNALETKNILINIKNNYETFHHLKIKETLLEQIIAVGNRYLSDKKNPDKAIELLDSCCTNAKYNEQREVNIKNLYQVINDRYGIDFNNSFIKNTIENKKIIISNNINELVNHLSCPVIKIDCSTYQNENDIYDLLGNPHDLQNNNYYLLKKVIDNPLGAIAITNYNNNKILTEFINKLTTNRHIMDNHGNIIDFANYLIIIEKAMSKDNIGFNYHSNINFNNYVIYNDNLLINS